MTHIFTKWWPFLYFFIMADTNIPFQLTLRKPETQTLEWGQFLYDAYL